MSYATGPLAAIPPRPFTLKAAVAALAGIGLLSSASVWAQADAVPAPVARDAGHGALPVCSSDALTLSAQCQPQPARQA